MTTKNLKTIYTSISKMTTILNSLTMFVFVYNNNQLSSITPSARYTQGTFGSTTGLNSNLLALDTKQIMRSYNTIVGISAFWVLTNNSFNYATNVNPNVSITASSTNVWSNFTYQYIVF